MGPCFFFVTIHISKICWKLGIEEKKTWNHILNCSRKSGVRTGSRHENKKRTRGTTKSDFGYRWRKWAQRALSHNSGGFTSRSSILRLFSPQANRSLYPFIPAFLPCLLIKITNAEFIHRSWRQKVGLAHALVRWKRIEGTYAGRGIKERTSAPFVRSVRYPTAPCWKHNGR